MGVGGNNDTLNSIPVGTKYNSTSVSYSFTAPEDGVYCVIIDDSEMGEAQCVDDPDTDYEETLTTTYAIVLNNPIPYVPPPPPPDPKDTDENGDSSSPLTRGIGLLASIGCLIGTIAFIAFVVKNERSKPITHDPGFDIEQLASPRSTISFNTDFRQVFMSHN